MIYILMLNGPSAFPLFFPLVMQLLLIYFAFKFSSVEILYGNSALKWFLFVSIFLITTYSAALIKMDFDLAMRLMKLYINSLFCILAAQALIVRYKFDFPAAFTNCVVAFSSIGILGLIFANFTDWNFVSNIGERTYHTNLLTVWITDDGFNSSSVNYSPFKYRLQSFFDEPGTFGILLLPALYYTLKTRQFLKIFILLSSLVLTESASAIVGAFVIINFYFVFNSTPREKIIIIISWMIFFVLFGDQLMMLYDIKFGIDEAYSNNSSYESRAESYRIVLANIVDYVAPLSGSSYITGGIAASYIQWVIFGGWIFLALLLGALILVMSIFFTVLNSSDDKNYFPFILAISLYISGFQRTSIIDNVLFLTLFYWSIFFLYARVECREKNILQC